MITGHEFYMAIGRPPIHDELERLNCTKVGNPGHYQCGLCNVHYEPRFLCGCLVKETKEIAMEKPVSKKKYVVLEYCDKSERVVIFRADPETANTFSEFGTMCAGKSDKYSLYVLGGYDFDEVVEYMKGYIQ